MLTQQPGLRQLPAAAKEQPAAAAKAATAEGRILDGRACPQLVPLWSTRSASSRRTSCKMGAHMAWACWWAATATGEAGWEWTGRGRVGWRSDRRFLLQLAPMLLLSASFQCCPASLPTWPHELTHLVCRGDAAKLPEQALDLCEIEPLRQEEAGSTRWVPVWTVVRLWKVLMAR